MIGSNRFCHFGGWSDGKTPAAGSEPASRTEGAGDARWSVRPARAEDFDAWQELFAGYCDFYERPSTPEHRRLVWSWIEAGTIHCLLAVPAEAGPETETPGAAAETARTTAEAETPGATAETGPETETAGATAEAGPEIETAGAMAESGPETETPGAEPEAETAGATAETSAATEVGSAAGRHPVGLAHIRPMPSPLRGTATGFLDDLFVAPAARGSGAFECLIDAIRDLAAAEGWPQVRWITAADNARARSAYDRVATKTDWVTYQLDV